jgi:Tfp pilus assembly protein PilN
MQQINFYLPEFQPNREPFRASQILLLLILLVILLTAVTIKSSFNNRELEKQLLSNKVQVDDLKGQLQQFVHLSPQTDVIVLDNQIARLKNDVVRKLQLLQVIAYQPLGNSTGFSAQLETMARQSSDNLSLSIFSLKAGGSYLEMVGQARTAGHVPAYIKALKTEASFREISFGVVDVSPDQSGLYKFVVAQAANPSDQTESAVQLYIKDNSTRGTQP